MKLRVYIYIYIISSFQICFLSLSPNQSPPHTYIYTYTHTCTHMVFFLMSLSVHSLFSFTDSSRTHTHTHTHIYIYIYCHPQTDCFVLSELFTLDARSRDRNPSNFTLDLVSDHSANKRSTLAKGIFKVLCSNSSSVRLFTFLYPYTLCLFNCIIFLFPRSTFIASHPPSLFLNSLFFFFYFYFFFSVHSSLY